MRFIAMDIVSCASGESEPSDIADETKRARMDSIGSTAFSGIAWPSRIARRSRTVVGAPPFARSLNVRHASSGVIVVREARALPTACCNACTVVGAQACGSPSFRKRMRPMSASDVCAAASLP